MAVKFTSLVIIWTEKLLETIAGIFAIPSSIKTENTSNQTAKKSQNTV